MSRPIAAAFLLALLVPFTANGADLGQLLRRFERHAAAKELAAAEAVAREAVAQFPASRDAKLALANAVLWQGRYAEARRLYRAILDARPADRDARLGLANALYWSGDLRNAEHEYERLGNHPDALRALGEIRAASAPSMRAESLYRSDSQPLDTFRIETGASVFSDPLTVWSGAVGTYRFEETGAGNDAPFVRAGVDTTVPSLGTTFRASATLLRFPDGATHPMGRVSADRKLGRSTLSLAAARRELFGSAPSTRTHAWVDAVELRWSRANASARVESLRYFDDNRGFAADGWVLVPAGPISVGASVAFRDTDQSRFVAGSIYDPYWTPIDLREARLIGVATRRFGAATVGVHVDGGIAEEEINGRYEPWRAALSVAFPAGSFTMNVEAERQSTVFYTANEFRASVGRRF